MNMLHQHEGGKTRKHRIKKQNKTKQNTTQKITLEKIIKKGAKIGVIGQRP